VQEEQWRLDKPGFHGRITVHRQALRECKESRDARRVSNEAQPFALSVAYRFMAGSPAPEEKKYIKTLPLSGSR